jgi:SAM-dependent methyltransferase
MFFGNSRLQDYSVADVVNLVRAAILAEKVNASINHAEFRRVVASHALTYFRYAKYFDKRTWLRAKMMRALENGVDRLAPGAVLDLGCGPGYFLYICKYFGHDAHGIDLPHDPFFNDMVRFLGIDRTEAEIHPFKRLPALGIKFDLITAHQICFNGHATSGLWGVDEWAFLLADMRENHLKPGGIISLEFNEEPSNGFYSAELREWFASRGARMFRGRVMLQDQRVAAALRQQVAAE